MEKKKLVLSLNKEVIANLSQNMMGVIKGGETNFHTDCPDLKSKCNTVCIYTCDCINTETNCC
jgi:hypothetical protein